MNPGNILEWVKLSGKQAFVVLVITSILLFGEASLLQKIGLAEARETFRLWIGILWLLSVSLVVTELFYPIYKWISQKIEFRVNLKEMHKRLHHLSPDEKEFLAVYIINNTKTQSADISDGVANGLKGLNIIYRASNVAYHFKTFPFNIQPWAWEYLKEHPECLE